jgi:photosystem II stability/assembly factor-like uncharacterized protein/outer membrane lipoprotein-sorting protein
MHLALVACISVPCLFAPPVQGATVDELVAKNLQARGGAAKLAAISSLRLTGKIVLGFGDRNFEAGWGQLQKRPGMIRTETTLQGLTEVETYDGHDAWTLDPFQGRRDAQKDSADDARDRARDADIEGPLVRWREKGHRVEYLGTEDVDGTPAHKLRVNLKDGDTQYVFLDPDSFLEIRVETVSHARGTEQIREADLGSYEQVQGVWIPFSIDAGRKGQPRTARLTIERAEANVDSDDTTFRFPPAGTSIGRAVVAAERKPASSHASAPPPAAAAGGAPVFDSGILSGLGARNIGSAAMSGRISAVAARNEEGKTTLFVGAASGGVWKSSDGATTFKPVFDKQPVQSIGAIAIDPSNPKTVWVGTGESWMRNSVSIGDGIYKSTDGGDTWSNTGLHASEHIVRILVHPKNGDVVYACAPGRLWSDSAERGVYRTDDGGKTWSLALKGSNLSTGCSGLAMDPKNPDVLFAGMWDFRRKGWTFRSGGDGPSAQSGSGLYRSADAGKTWTELTEKSSSGLPAKPWGRVEVVVAPSDPKVVYALVESEHSALYRTADGGKTWEARDRSQGMVWRPFYFGRLVVDPNNADHLFKPGGGLSVSEDGGRSFADTSGGGHGDWHDVWIDPDNTKHVVAGDDGGLWLSHDGGSRWWKTNNLPVSQFYHVSVDARDPYQVYGGLQDNSSWVGDSSYPGGISNSRWENLYGGDGFWTVPDLTDPDAVYAESQGGFIGRVDRKSGASRDIQPKAGYHEKLRYNWNTPILASPTQKGTIYIGAQFLFRSRDRGDTWERISPDLTTNDPEKQKQEESGGVTVDNSSAEMHTTIYSISESPLDAKVIWVGTDDGNVQLTRDAGKSWTNLAGNVAGLPKASWVSWVEASRFEPATAYAAFDRHTFGDMTPWVYRTSDFGRTWTRIVSSEQGVRGYAHVVKEDAVKRGLLFLGTEFGLWISPDAGKTWAEFKGGDFPSAAVRDLQVHPREHDLVVATHGRGIWIIDDLTPLRNLTADAMSSEALFLPGRPVQQRMPANGGWVEGDATFVGRNAPGGAVITYYQRTRHLFGPIQLEIYDSAGKLVDTISPTKRRGLNRAVWSMQVKPPRVPRAASVALSSAQGPRVPPGTYTVRLTKGGKSIETKLEVGLDRRAPYTAADRKAQFEAVMRAHALFEQMSALIDRIDVARAAAAERAKAPSASDADKARLQAAADSLDSIKRKIVATKEGGAITGEERIREHLDTVYGALNGWEGKPAAYQVERVETLARELADVAKELDAFEAKERKAAGEGRDDRPGNAGSGATP